MRGVWYWHRDRISAPGLIPTWYYYPIIQSVPVSHSQCNLVTLEQIIDNVGIPIMINITAQRRMQTTNASSQVQLGPRLCPQGNYAQHFSPKSQEERLFLICVHTSEGSQAAQAVPSHQAVVNSPQEVKCLQINMSPLHDSSSALTLPDTLRYRQIGLELRPVQ